MKIVHSELLSRFPGIIFGMSTNSGGVSNGSFGLNLSFNVEDDPVNVKENRKRFFAALGIAEEMVAFTQQKHTANVISVRTAGTNENCDAVFTNQKGLYLSISVADCTPVMLYDPMNNVVAGIHAGWRGTAGEIVGKTVDGMRCEFGTKPGDIVAFIGPSAGRCCYEVGEEVAVQFPGTCFSVKANGKYLLDVKQANVLQLIEHGVLNANIEVHKDCTIQNAIYHSHRRDGKQSGRMLAVIGMKN